MVNAKKAVKKAVKKVKEVKKGGAIFMFTLLLFCSSSAQQVPAPQKEIFISNNDTLPYRLIYPLHYDKNKSFPLVLFLHGAGQRGNDNELQLAGVPKALTDSAGREKYPCFILVPQCAKKDVWVKFPDFPVNLKATVQPTVSAKATLQVLDLLVKQLPVDQHRIYITGYSMGGEGTFDLLTRRPGFFAAAIPICSVSDTSKAATISSVPVWAFHGDQDDVNNVQYSRIMIEALKEHGGHPVYTEYPGVKHNSWTKAYSEPGLFDWLFLQKNK